LVVSYLEVVHAQAIWREFRRPICERLVAGERVSELSRETGVSPATLHLWKRQALIDAGLKPGTKSTEVDELAQAPPPRWVRCGGRSWNRRSGRFGSHAPLMPDGRGLTHHVMSMRGGLMSVTDE